MAQIGFAIRLQLPDGSKTVLKGLEPMEILSSLKGKIFSLTSIPQQQISLLSGWPPKKIEDNFDDASTLQDIGIKPLDTLQVKITKQQTQQMSSIPVQQSPVPQTYHTNEQNNSNSEFIKQKGQIVGVNLDEVPGTNLVIRRMPDDNSCFFHAVNYVIFANGATTQEIRQMVATVVLTDQESYNEAIIGKPNDKYAEWIMQENSWGGDIEVSITSKMQSKQIIVWNIVQNQKLVYGQDQGYSELVILLYDGIHYDVLAVSQDVDAPQEFDQTQIQLSDAVLVKSCDKAAQKLVLQLQKQGKFTDTSNFSLKCDVCKAPLRGEKDALEHANQTSHVQFSQYS